jgi:hypothetical protein
MSLSVTIPTGFPLDVTIIVSIFFGWVSFTALATETFSSTITNCLLTYEDTGRSNGSTIIIFSGFFTTIVTIKNVMS